MRIAYVDPHPVPDITPSTMQMLQTVDGLGQIGVKVDLITPRSKRLPESVLGRSLSENVRLNYLEDYRKRWFFPFSSHRIFFFQVCHLLKKSDYDVVYVRNLKLAAYLLEKGIQNLYFETHEIFAQSFKEDHPDLETNAKAKRKYLALKARESLVYNRSKGVFALTQLLIDDIRQDYGAQKTCFTVLPDGYDPALSEAALARFKEKGRQAGPLRLLYLGSLHPWKGVRTLIEAMPHIQSDVECWIAGGETNRIEELTQLAKILHCENRMKFLGKIPPDQRFDLIAQADICVLPLTATSIASRYTSPLKLFEYMAMGKPIAVADLPSIREVFQKDDKVAWFPVAKNDDLAVVVNEILISDKRQELGAGMLEIAKKFTWYERAKTILAGIRR